MENTPLRPDEIRVLGVLIEKSLSQPAYYPMTINAIVNAANQKTNRDPVTDYSESVISGAISSLRRRSLVREADPERGSRAVKFQHQVTEKFGWNAAQAALMAELMLRGPQTLAELKSRASRMTHLSSPEYARELLAELENANPSLVRELEREPGRTTRRFAQRLGGDRPAPSAGDAESAHGLHDTQRIQTTAEAARHDIDLATRVDRLEAEVARLRAEVQSLRGPSA